jgi:Asp-tRNA(Asn)/Glu-tRNA(Gln) amidotransferase C subunit
MRSHLITRSSSLTAGDLAELLATLSHDIDTLVFASPNSTEGISGMLERFQEVDADGLVAVAQIHEAVKAVRDGVVERGLDRSTIVTVTEPEILTRAVLAAALEHADLTSEVDPAALVARRGGRIVAFED